MNRKMNSKKWIEGGMLLLALLLMGCGGGKQQAPKEVLDSVAVVEETADSTYYGVCGEGSTMHVLELVRDQGDTLHFMVNMEEETVKGGMLAGDRMAVTGYKGEDGEWVATVALNLTTLLGKWTSLDKNFEIQEGGIVASHMQAEAKPWTAWKVLNGQLLLNQDTFAVAKLGADSLSLENSACIFVFKRQR